LPVDKSSLKVFRKKSRYNQWEFVYDPTQDMGGAMGQTGTGVEQQPGTATGANGTNNGFGGSTSSGSRMGGFSLGNSGFGSSSNSSGFGSSNSGNQDKSGSSSGSNTNSNAPSATPPSGADSPIR